MIAQPEMKFDPFDKLQRMLDRKPVDRTLFAEYDRLQRKRWTEEQIIRDTALSGVQNSGAVAGSERLTMRATELYDTLKPGEQEEIRRWWHEKIARARPLDSK